MPTAVGLYPGLAKKDEPYRIEITNAKRVVDLILNQKGLQTSGVVAGIRILKSHGENLKCDLMSLGDDKGMSAASS